MTILCYHEIRPGWASPLATHPVTFAEQCMWLDRNRSVLPLAEAARRVDRSGRLPQGAAALTFDDGFAGLYDYAFPVLRRQQVAATVFLVAKTLAEGGCRVDWVDTPSSAPIGTLTVDQVHEMQEAGVRFESHSWAHLDLTRLSLAECVRDLRDSRQLLESVLGRPVTMLAYPRGRHDATVRTAAERAGYRYAFSLPESREPVGPYSIPRVGVYHGNSLTRMRIKCSPAYLQWRTGRAYALAAGFRERQRAS